MNKDKQFWSDKLGESLQRAKMNGQQVHCILAKFAVLADKTTPVKAFVELVDTYGNENGTRAMIEAKASLISDELTAFNAKTKITVSPVHRVRDYVTKLQSLVDKCSCEICIDPETLANLSEHQKARLAQARSHKTVIDMPAFAKEKENNYIPPSPYQSFGASEQKSPIPLEVRL